MRSSLPPPSVTSSAKRGSVLITSISFSRRPDPTMHMLLAKLKECSLMKNYMTMQAFTKGKKAEGESLGKDVTPFLKEKVVTSISSRAATHESRHKLK
jgi:hypothetical protein